VTLQDLCGNAVTGTVQNVTLAIWNNAGGGTLSGTATAAVDPNTGVATFSGLSIDKIGTGYTLTATGSTVDTTAGVVVSSGFNITAAAASQLVFTSTAVTTTAGTASSSITVQRQDQYGNAVTSESSTRTVTLSSTSTGTVTFNPTSLSIANGSSSASFTYTDTQAGTPTITAASTSPTTITSGTQQETVTAAAASKLVFTSTAVTTTAGVASGSITVQRQDQYGNSNTTDASRTVTLASTSGGTVTFTPASPLTISSGSSSASFTYTDTKAGTPTITAASISPTTITSATQQETVNAAAASKLVFTSTAVTTTAGVASSSITVQRQDQYNNPNTADAARTVTLSSSSSGTVTFNPTSLTISSGASSASFTYTDTKAGTPTITAASTSPSTITSATQQETVNAAAASQLVVTTQPSASTVAGVAFATQPVVTIEDAFGNVLTSGSDSTVSVALTLTTGTGSLGGTASMAAVNGVADFTGKGLNINLVGTDKVLAATAMLAAGVKTTTTSPAFTITFAAANKLAFTTEPVSTTAGSTLANVVVQIQDSYGNPVSQSGTAITLTLNGSTLYSGTNPQNTDASGKATFNDLVIRQAGTGLHFSAAGGSLTGATSGNFNITAAAANKLAFTTQPGNGTGGSAFSTQPAVTLQDQFGNTVTGTAQDVTLAIQNNAGSGTLSGTKTVAVNTSTGVATFSGLSIDKGGNGYTLTATGSTVSTAPGVVVSSGFNVISADPVTIGRAWGTYLRIPVDDVFAKIAGGSTPYTLQSVTSRDSGDYVQISGSFILFAPAGNATRILDYTVADSTSPTPLTASSTITVSVTNAVSSANAISSTGNSVTITFAGIPGYSYAVERSSSVSDWSSATTVQTTNAPTGGVWTFTDSSPPNPSYYRTRQNN
jgi:hypothetical protein